ncbi:MAG: hypothetical protein IPQ07_25830 [Myxococcales bacterium]|nr:hypothetical protein [Myxococcales bacterium]
MRGVTGAMLVAVVSTSVAFAQPTPPAEGPPPGERASAPAAHVFDPDAPPPGGWRLMVSDLSLLRVNPIGLETRARFGLQKRLYYSEKAVTKTNFAFAGMFPRLNPASASVGLGGELQPASVFNVRAFGEVQQYFGTFGYLQSFGSAGANYSDHRLDQLRDDPVQKPQAARIFHASIQPLVQLKLGKVALRALFQLDYWNLDVRSGDTTAYEPTFDTLLPDRGWTVSTDTDVLYTGKKGLAIGLRHTFVKPLYKARHFADQAAFDAYDDDNSHQRLGLFAAYTLRDTGPSRFNKPTLILIMSWYLSHKYRAGEPGTLPLDHTSDDYRSRAIPYVLAGFAFESDLMCVRP